LGGRLGILLAIEGDKSKAFTGVVHISHHAELLELGLEVAIGHVLVNAIDKELASLLSHCDGVWILSWSDTTEFSKIRYGQKILV